MSLISPSFYSISDIFNFQQFVIFLYPKMIAHAPLQKKVIYCIDSFELFCYIKPLLLYFLTNFVHRTIILTK